MPVYNFYVCILYMDIIYKKISNKHKIIIGILLFLIFIIINGPDTGKMYELLRVHLIFYILLHVWFLIIYHKRKHNKNKLLLRN